MTDFEKFARSECGVSTLTLDGYARSMNAILNPMVIEERRMNAVAMDVFSRLLMDRIVFLGGPINDDSANIVTSQLLWLASTADGADINLYINSPGGSVSAGLAIYDTMQFIAPKVRTTCLGMAASMGAVLLCAGEPCGRSTLPNARVMIHQPLGGVRGQASDILIEAKEIERCRETLIRIIAFHSGQSFEKVLADADRNYWMGAEEALAYGLVDTVLSGSRHAEAPTK